MDDMADWPASRDNYQDGVSVDDAFVSWCEYQAEELGEEFLEVMGVA